MKGNYSVQVTACFCTCNADVMGAVLQNNFIKMNKGKFKNEFVRRHCMRILTRFSNTLHGPMYYKIGVGSVWSMFDNKIYNLKLWYLSKSTTLIIHHCHSSNFITVNFNPDLEAFNSLISYNLRFNSTNSLYIYCHTLTFVTANFPFLT